MLLASVEDGHDVLVLQTPSGFRLTEKTLTCVNQFITRKLLAQRHGLDGYNPTDFRVLAKVHHAHRALAELFLYLVAPQHGLFDGTAVEQHGAARVRTTTTTQHHRF